MGEPAIAMNGQAEGDTCPCCGHPLPADGPVLYDEEGGFVVGGGRFAALTKQEASLFSELWAAKPRVRTRQQLMDGIYWLASSDEEAQIKIVDVFVCKIRKKLAGLPVEIGTVWGVGYRIILQHEGGQNA